MAVVTEEQRRKYKANARRKYNEDPAYRARVLAKNRASLYARKEQVNEARRARWWSDPEYRERCLAPRRGRNQRDSQLRTNYGISIVDYKDMEQRQDFVCAICKGPPEDTLCVDHCHDSGRVRGLLCRKCNTGLGSFRDEPDLMLKAIKYLEAHRVI